MIPYETPLWTEQEPDFCKTDLEIEYLEMCREAGIEVSREDWMFIAGYLHGLKRDK